MSRAIKVALLDTKRENPNYYIVQAIFSALRRSPRVTQVDMLHYDDAVVRAASAKYDLFLAVDGEQLNAAIIQRVCHLVAKSALWVWEDPYERATNIANASLFDVVFTNDLGSVRFYDGRAQFLPLAASRELPVVRDKEAFSYDLFFAGSAWPNRVRFLRRLLKEMPDLRTKIILQYNPGLPLAFLDLPESDYAGTIAHDDFLQYANASKVTLTLHRSFSADGKGRTAESPGPRLFEVALAGGCQLVHGDGIEIARFFRRDSEVKAFSTFEDFRTALDEVLRDPQRRLSLAEASQSRARSEHTYDVRIGALLDVVDATTARPRSAPIPASDRRPKLLFVTHNSTATGAFGGVEVYQDVIAAELRNDYQVLFFKPAHPPLRDDMREFVITNDRHDVLKSYLVPDYDMWDTLSHPQLEKAFAEALVDFGIDLIHFHHLLNLCASLPLISRMLGVPSLFTFHDFWTVCKKFNLIEHTGNYCEIALRPKTACDVCLHATDGLHPGAQSYRREYFREVLNAFDQIIFSTTHTVNVFNALYPDVLEASPALLGVPSPGGQVSAGGSQGAGAVTRLRSKRTLKVVLFGNFTRAKGADVFLAAAAVMADDDILFVIRGGISDDYVDRIKREHYPNVVVEGAYAPGELDLTGFEISLHLSIWPETYCIALSEAWEAGLVPVVSDCGALSDRVSDGVNGFKIRVGDSGALVSVLRRLTDRGELERVRRNIGPDLWMTRDQHVTSLKARYREVLADRQPLRPASSVGGSRGPGPTMALSRLAPLPADWTTRTAGPKIPIRGRDVPGVPSFGVRQAGVKRAIAEGRVTAGTLTWWIDVGGGREVELERWAGEATVVESRDAGGRVEGWAFLTKDEAASVQFGLRSLDGGVVLLNTVPIDRPDVQEATGRPGAGFGIGPLVFGMLDEGVHALEAYQTNAGSQLVEVSGLPISIAVGRQVTQVRTGPENNQFGAEIAAVPFPGRGCRGLPEKASGLSRFEVDELTCINYAPPAEHPFPILRIWGWLASEILDVANPPVLQISGGREFYGLLGRVPRPDVTSSLSLDADQVYGFSGSLWLAGVPDGDYDLSLMYRRPSGFSTVPVRRLIVRNSVPSLLGPE